MYLQSYLWFIGPLLLCMLFSGFASAKVRRAYSTYGSVRTRSGMTGCDAARRLMQTNDIRGISIGRVHGHLTDHYHPGKGVVNLSDTTYDSSSVAAVAVAAHEIGHVVQREKGYFFYRIRTVLVPIVNIGSRLAMPLVLIGVLLNGFVTYANPDLGFRLAMIGVILYGGTFVFALVTLPVELNASRRAKEMLLRERVLTEGELPGAQKVLSAAALTYLASLATSFVYFLRFLFYVLSVFGRRQGGSRR